MTATSGPGHRTSATYTVELLGSFGHTAEQATAAVAAALTVPLDRAQRLLAGKRFRITVTASPPSAEASAAVAKLLAGGVDLAVLDEETGERRELLAPRPKGTEGASRSGSGKLEPTGRFKFSLEGTEITGKPTSTTGLKPIRLVDPNPRPGAGGTSRPPESTARYSTQQLLGSTPDPGDTRKGASRSGMPPVVPQPPPSRTSTPPVASHPPSSRAPASTRDPASDAVDTGRSQRPSHLGLHPIADEPTGGRLPAVGEPTQRIGSRYYGSNGERAGSVPPAPPSVRSSRPADEAGPTPPSTRGSTPTPLPEPRSATPVSGAPARISTLPSSSPRPPPRDTLHPAAVAPLPPAPRVPTAIAADAFASAPPRSPSTSPAAAPCSDCGVALGVQAPLCASCGWDAGRSLRRCGRCGGDLVRAAAVGPRRVALVAIAIVAPLVLGGAAAIAVDPIVGGGAALVLALFEIGIRALIAQPRCKACGWVAPPPRPKAAPASAVLPTPAP